MLDSSEKTTAETPSESNRSNLRFLNWTQWDERLTDEQCDWIVDIGKSFEEGLASALGEEETEEKTRLGYLHRIQVNEASKPLYELLYQLITSINERYYGFDLKGIIPADFIEYHADFGRFDWHDDYAYVGSDKIRKITMIVQLSDSSDYEGGDLETFAHGPTAVPRDRGTVVAFPPFVPHRVKPVTKGVRRSLVVWATGPLYR